MITNYAQILTKYLLKHRVIDSNPNNIIDEKKTRNATELYCYISSNTYSKNVPEEGEARVELHCSCIDKFL